MRRVVPTVALLFATLPAFAADHEVTIPTADPAVTLAGTLQVPDDVADPPVAILVTGTGNHVRDQVISGVPMFAVLADELEAAGIASLRVDSRGSGASTGPKAMDSSTWDRVEDMRATVAFLRDDSPVPVGSIGFVGHSEGAMIASELANEPGVEWVVLVGAPARPGREVWVEQQMVPVATDLAGQDDKIERGRMLLETAAAQSAGGAPEADLARTAIQLFALVGMDEATIRGNGTLANFTGRMASPWMRAFLGYDPVPALERIAVPVLALYGSHDPLTSPAQNAGPLLAALTSGAPGPEVTVRVLPGEDHFFLRGEGLPPGKHEAGKMSLSPALSGAIADWVNRVD